MVKVTFIKPGEVLDEKFKFAVIAAKYAGKWILCRHKQRTTWEIPGGHREDGETLLQAAKRELFEETGAKDFEIYPLTPYCVDIDGEKSYGELFFANVTTLESIPEYSEIKEISLFDSLPQNLTYPEIQPHLYEYAVKNISMCYSYVMGMDDSIMSLNGQGFNIKSDGNNYTVLFPKHMAPLWEDFVKAHLQLEYWNEYFTENKVVFLFCLQEGIKRFEVENYQNDQVLKLCEKLCGCKFESIKSMLLGNWFYKQNREVNNDTI